MQARWSKVAGGAAITGGLLTLIVSVPSSWYGLQPSDSYLFDPPLGSPLWIDRVLVPILAVLAVLGLLIGLFGLVRRDWPVAGRARKWGGVIGVLGLAFVTIGIPTFLSGPAGGGVDILSALAGLLLGLLGALLLLVSLLLLGWGYSRTERPRLGYAFGATVVVAPGLGYVAPGQFTELVWALPVSLTWMLLGRDLLRWAEPLGREPASPETADSGAESG